MRLIQLYAITDRALLRPGPNGPDAALCAQVERWVEGGVDWVQLREKELPEPALMALTMAVARVAHQAGGRTRLLVNGLDPGKARACGADGVHLAGGASAADVEAAVRAGGPVTVSCHTLAEAAIARSGGASGVLWAPVFGKLVRNAGEAKVAGVGTGLAALAAACEAAAPVPVFALGGVSAANAADCLAVGAAGVAGIRLFHGETWRALVGVPCRTSVNP